MIFFNNEPPFCQILGFVLVIIILSSKKLFFLFLLYFFSFKKEWKFANKCLPKTPILKRNNYEFRKNAFCKTYPDLSILVILFQILCLQKV